MRIRKKISLAFLLMSMSALALISVFSYFTAQKSLAEQVLKQLESVASIQKHRIESIVEQNLERLLLVSSRTQLRLSLEKFIRDSRSEHQVKMNRILRDARSSIAGFNNIDVLTLGGKVVASTDEAKIGSEYYDEDFFIRGKLGNSIDIFRLDENQNVKNYLSGPLYLKNKLLGVIVIDSNIDNIISLARDYSGLGNTGEIVLARRDENGDALFIVPVRFDKNAALKRKISKDDLKAPMTQALSKKEDVFRDAVDYEGHSVFAATRYIKEIDAGIAVLIHKSEAFAPVTQLRNLLLFFILALSGVVILVALYLSRSISTPITNLTQIAGKISEGDISQRAEVTSKDEIGTLAQAFNQMTQNLYEEITEHERAEERLRKSEEKFSQLIEFSPVPMVVSDQKDNVLSLNKSFIETFGYTLKDIPAIRDWWSLAYPDEEYRERVKSEWDAAVAEAVREGRKILPQEWSVTSKDGTEREIVFMFTPIDEVNLTVFYDITGRKHAEEEKQKLQEQFIQLQKLESVGRLSGGIAHDFNNILSSILGYSELALLDLPEAHPVRESLKVIQDAGKKAATLTRQLLAFSRKQVLEIKAVNLNSIVENMGKMLPRMISEDVSLELKITSPVRNVLADPGQIEQVLMNLSVNAKDAMPTGGRLIIETADVMLDEDYARYHEGVKPGSYVMLSVSDTGVGMTKEVQEKIFEPFYTTKEVGKGTGLGLSMVYGIVQQHKGHLFVYSEVGKGSTFKIYLPATEEEVKEVPQKDRRAMQRGEETILVVDDEPALRDLVVDTLQPLGYKVIGAGSGTEALQICEKYDQTIDLLLTDVIMPGMNGRELVDAFKKVRPEAKVAFMSGYSDEHLSGLDVSREGTAFIQKPLIPSVLAEKLREILD